MAPENQDRRSVHILSLHVLKEGQDPKDVDWKRDGLLSVEAYDGPNAWYGRLPRFPHRNDWPRDGPQSDLSKFDELVKLLRPIPKDKIYPRFLPGELTRYDPSTLNDDSVLYFKAPKVGHYRDDGSDDIAARLLDEARIHETLRRNPHPNVGSYLGCVEDEGFLTRLVFKRYGKSVEELAQSGTPEEFTSQQRVECMDQVEAAAAHLHALGLAHNDISPSNIMFDGCAVLIDFDCCAPFGSPLTKGGWVTGWKGPVAGEGRHFEESSAECDRLATEEIRKYLALPSKV